jgi:hypothetical protein
MKCIMRIAIVLAHLTSVLECLAGDSDKTVFLIGKVKPSLKLVTNTNPRPGEMSVTLRFEGDSHENTCGIPKQKAPPGTLCYETIFDFEKVASAPSARLEVISPGYKKFSKNLPLISFTNNVARLDVGTIQLQQSDLPTVEQIVHSRTKDGLHLFELTLHNRLKRDFLIRELTVAAVISEKFNEQCCCPPNAIFKIGDALRIAAGGGDKRVATASFEELVRGKDHKVEAHGLIEIDGCRRGEDLVLTMPTSFILPAAQYIAVHIVLPQRFRVVDAFYGLGGRKVTEFSSEKPALELIDNGDVDHFRSYRFTFHTSMEDELDIVGSYEAR